MESEDPSSPESTWRATGLPAGGGLLSVDLVVCVSQAETPDITMPYQLGRQLIRLDGRLGLHALSDVTATKTAAAAAEQKVSNARDADC